MISKKKRKDLNNKKNENDLALKIDCVAGDSVKVVETRPLSKTKFEESPLKTENNIDNTYIKTIKYNPVDTNKNSTQLLSNNKKAYKADKDNENIMIIRKIKLKDLFCSIFCCGIKKRKVYNLLVNESMDVVQEKLDIFNIFRNICLIENSNNCLNDNSDTIKMSEELSKKLIEIMK